MAADLQLLANSTLEAIERKGIRLFADEGAIECVSHPGMGDHSDRPYVVQNQSAVLPILEERSQRMKNLTLGTRTLSFLKCAAAIGISLADDRDDQVLDRADLAHWAQADFGLSSDTIKNFLEARRSAAIRNNLVHLPDKQNVNRFLLSVLQESWWRRWQNSDNHPTVNFSIDFSDIEISEIEAGVFALLDAVPVLRSCVQQDEAGLFIKLNETSSFSIQKMNSTGSQTAEETALQPQDCVNMRSEWLFRAFLESSLDSTKLHISVSNLICDARSRNIVVSLLKELVRPPHRPQPGQAPPCSLQLTLAERAWIASPQAAPLIRYWESRKPDLVQIKGPRGNALDWSKGNEYVYEIPIPRIGDIDILSRRYRCTPHTILLKTYLDTLSVWSGMDRFHCALIESNRHQLQRVNLVGLYVAHSIIEYKRGDGDVATLLSELLSEVCYAREVMTAKSLDDTKNARRSINTHFNFVTGRDVSPEVPAWGHVAQVHPVYMSPIRLKIFCGELSTLASLSFVGEELTAMERDLLAFNLKAAIEELGKH
jgi:hypothetical protein